MSSGENEQTDGTDRTDGTGGTDGIGRLLAGRYRVVARLGRGGMGVVWRALDEVLGREVAVKELRTYSDAGAPELADLGIRMQREARAAARIRHPGVVAVHDVAEVDGRPLIVMELVDGPSLDAVLGERGTLDPREAAGIGAKVMDALAAAHRAGVLHRDVKPGNILLDRSGRVVLTDFGIATMEDPGDGSTTHLTRSGELVGSLDYLAPERAQGHDPGPASDVWALGATLYAAVEGTSPFRRTSTWSTLTAIVTEPLPEPRRAGLLGPVLRQLMHKQPQNRPEADRARELLEAVAGAEPGRGAAAEAPDRTSETTRLRGPARQPRKDTERSTPAVPPGFGPPGWGAAGTGTGATGEDESGAGVPGAGGWGAGFPGADGAGAGGPDASGLGARPSGVGRAGEEAPDAAVPGAGTQGAGVPAAAGSGAGVPGAGGPDSSGLDAQASGAGGSGAGAPGADGPDVGGAGAGFPGAGGALAGVPDPDASGMGARASGVGGAGAGAQGARTPGVDGSGADFPDASGLGGRASGGSGSGVGAPGAGAPGTDGPGAGGAGAGAPGGDRLAFGVPEFGLPASPPAGGPGFGPAQPEVARDATPGAARRRTGRVLLVAATVTVVLAMTGVTVALLNNSDDSKAAAPPAKTAEAGESPSPGASRGSVDLSDDPETSGEGDKQSSPPGEKPAGTEGAKPTTKGPDASPTPTGSGSTDGGGTSGGTSGGGGGG
ncbi:serine/threonine-protein kinase, partial [Streptomyces montanus]|uniref:serine/threonine-protein kinase n=1 Tax=Streptomyces montanus TaxID=2580423 RepID=UPI003CCC6DD3